MDIYKQLFQKIRLLDDMSYDIAVFGEQQGLEKLTERVDMKCGAIPPGEYERIIDPCAAEQFLELYIGIAEKRFAFAVTVMLKVHPDYIKPLENYCFQRGNSLKPAKITTIDSAYELISNWVLDGMPAVDTKKITVMESKKIAWEKVKDTHEDSWNKVSGDIKVYYHLLEAFINGLLDGSGFVFKNDGNALFSITYEEAK